MYQLALMVKFEVHLTGEALLDPPHLDLTRAQDKIGEHRIKKYAVSVSQNLSAALGFDAGIRPDVCRSSLQAAAPR